MTVLVQHKETGARFLLLGAGFGMSQAALPNPILGSFLPTRERAEEALVLVADAVGGLGWIASTELTVVSVDGVTPAQALGAGS